MDDIRNTFSERYPTSGAPRVYRAPGRVNLIGEHTDYNQGFVMPIAIQFACFAAVAPGGDDGNVRVYSEEMLQGEEWPAASTADLRPTKSWLDYVQGVAQQLALAGREIEPADVLIHSTVPVGSGLSSSAAIEVATALAFGAESMDKLELALLCQRAENQFVGMPCGIMDQYVSVFGRENSAILIDCRSLEHRLVPIPTNVRVIAVNSMVKHELGSSAYRDRVRECKAAVEYIQRSHPEVRSLRDARPEMIDSGMGDVVMRRARHVVTEDDRCLAFADAAEKGDLKRMGELFVASHRSLQHDYEVSCEELDSLVDAATAIPGVFGSRMTGGGFGGCTVNLVAPEAVERFATTISKAYWAKYQIEPKVFECYPSSGAGPIA